MAEIAKEEKDYVNYQFPEFYHFESEEAKERILYANFLRITAEVKSMIKEIQGFNKQ